MARRSKLETALTSYLAGYGWTPPSLRVQSVAFPGCTPAATSARGRGRGSIVFDVERREDAGILVAYCVGLKASATRPSTITVTTGTSHHIESVIKAAECGLSIPIVVVAVNAAVIDDKILDYGKISVACVRVGDMIRRHGIEPRTEGQGKGRGRAVPVAWGVKRQRAASGKVYEYISLQANLPACGATWSTLNTLVELEGFIARSAEGIPV